MTDQNSTTQGSSFLTHLIELRDVLLKIVIAVAIVFVCLIPFAQDLFTWLADPLKSAMGDKNLLAISPITPFLTPYKLALLAAFLIALPYVFYQMWSFVAPGLYKHEKKLVVPLLVSSVSLFYLGIAFAYYVLLPMMFSVLQGFTPEGVDATPDIAAYLDFVMMIFIAFGFGFEMPIATILIISSGMSTAENLAKNRPYIIVGAFIVGMLLTPPDVISQIMLAIPIWLLFELGLITSKLFNKRVEEAGREKEAMEKADREKIDNDNTALAGAGALAASEALDVPDDIDPTGTTPDDNNDDLLWEDEKYTYEDDASVNLDDEEEYRPLTDDEMEAEIERIEAEFDSMEKDTPEDDDTDDNNTKNNN